MATSESGHLSVEPQGESVEPSATSPELGLPPGRKGTGGGRPFVLSVLLGILLPLAAILAKGLCAEVLFDPAPTVLHIAMLALVPLHHVLVVATRPSQHRRLQLDLLGGVTIGVALVYSVIFAPIAPVAVMAIVAGIGLLPLAPFGALLASVVAQVRMYRNAPSGAAARWHERPRYRTALGVIAGVAGLVCAELPSWITEHALLLASSSDPERAAEGITTLRRMGDRDVMLRAADDWGRRRAQLLPDLFGHERVSPVQAKRAFYRVTGASADTELLSDAAAGERRTRWDPWLGSSQIGAINGQLELVGSRLDGSVNAEAALGYVEWTMVFRNSAPSDQAEARARVALPPGAVVSRATLWIDGEAREAVFGGKGQTRAAYQNVVAARRDPLLVTLIGPDLVQVQCFPIQPAGAQMKLLIGITFPLELEQPETGAFTVPRLIARNFSLSRGLQHRVWFESKSPLTVAERRVTQNAKGAFVFESPMNAALEGEITPKISASRPASAYAWIEEPGNDHDNVAEALPAPGAPAAASSSSSPPAGSTAADPNAARVAPPRGGRFIIEQRWARVTPPRPDRLAVVVDTSSGMGPAIESLVKALPEPATLPEFRFLLATDAGFSEIPRAKVSNLVMLREELRRVEPKGGIDNHAALQEALMWARGAASGVVLWVHGAQPVPLGNLDSLQQALERSSVRIITAQSLPGEHVDLAELGARMGLEALGRRETLEGDLRRQLSLLSGKIAEWKAIRSRRSVSELPPSPPSSLHLARLWAKDEVTRMMGESPESARNLAIAHRLVTPVSGAVVLETAAEYAAAGLTPRGELSGAPSVPEPETWAMLGLALGLVLVQLGLVRRRRAGWQVA